MNYIFNNQDLTQKIGVCCRLSIELFRVLVSSLLILSVPQNCNGHICDIVENLNPNNDTQYLAGLIINFITTFAFVIMYVCEIRREEKLIKLLEVNNSISTDSDSIGERLNILLPYKREQLHTVSLYYSYSGYFAIIIFIVNSVISGIIINKYSLGNQTQINFITNILFMIGKLSDVYMTVYTEENVFYSAYLTTKIQFNDIDPRELSKNSNTGEPLLFTKINAIDNTDNTTVTTYATGTTHSTATPPVISEKKMVELKGNDMYEYFQSDSDSGSDDIEAKVLKVIFKEPEIYCNNSLAEIFTLYRPK